MDHPAERLIHLDILRGFALFGMFVVHLSWYATGEGVLADNVARLVEWGFATKFFALFAFLFGIGFSIQMGSAERRGTDFVPQFLRRMAMLFAIGLANMVFLGYRVLMLYAIWGVALLFVRNLRTASIAGLLVLSAAGTVLYDAAESAYVLTTADSEQAAEAVLADIHADVAISAAERDEAVRTGTYTEVVRARINLLATQFIYPRTWLPRMQPFGFFLLGLLAYRSGLVQAPLQQRGRVLTWMGIGAGVTVVAIVIHKLSLPTRLDFSYDGWDAVLRGMLGLAHTQYFMFVYAGAAVLWLQRFMGPLAWAGRMALTNYIVQSVFLELVMGRHGLGTGVRMEWVPFFAVVFTLFQIAISWLWLRFHHWGPLEWVWRMVTHWRWESPRRAAALTGASR